MYKEEENMESEFAKQSGKNPFRTPIGYFDSIEEQVMEKIRIPEKKKNTSTKIFRILKPVVGIAASLTVIYLLIHEPVNQLISGKQTTTEIAAVSDSKDDSTLNFSLIDESTLVNAIFSDEKSNISQINPDDMLAYLSSGMNEVEIYSEIQN